jgi:hypothetical protein
MLLSAKYADARIYIDPISVKDITVLHTKEIVGVLEAYTMLVLDAAIYSLKRLFPHLQ